MDASPYAITFGDCSSCIDYYQYTNGDGGDGGDDGDELNDDSLCNLLWDDGTVCDEDCQMLGLMMPDTTWDSKDIGLLAVEILAFGGLSLLIFRQRQAMSSKERLLESATAGSFGVKRIHVVAIFVSVLIAVVCFAGARMVSATLALMMFVDLCALVVWVKQALL
jgi:hypothetical protein